MRNEAPKLPGCTFVKTEIFDMRLIHYYEQAGERDSCGSCGSTTIYGHCRKARVPVVGASEGYLIQLSLNRVVKRCHSCGANVAVDLPFDMFTDKIGNEFAQQIISDPCSTAEASRKYCLHDSTVRRIRTGNPLAGKARKPASKPKASAGIFRKIYELLGGGSMKEDQLLKALKAEGYEGGLNALRTLEGDHIVFCYSGAIRLASFIAAKTWEPTGPAPKTMLGKHRAEQPALRRELMGYNMECAA